MKPTLPEPRFDVLCGQEPWYSPETVQRLIDQAYEAGLEDAAQACDELDAYNEYDPVSTCIAAVRSLKPKGEA